MIENTYVIAEIANNHMGDLSVAKQLINMAKMAGANAVKFQKRDNKTLYTKAFYDSPYNSEAAYAPTYGAHREYLEFNQLQYKELVATAQELGIDFFATAFDRPSADFLFELGAEKFKLASGSLSNLDLLLYIASMNRPVIISTGGWPLRMVKEAVDEVLKINDRLTLMHCVAEYPLNPDEANLFRITKLKEMYPALTVGFSDHQAGISLGAVAYVVGARVFEKHITLDHAAKGTDHAFSLELAGFQQYIKYIKHAAVALSFRDQPFDKEREPIRKMAQAVYPSRDLPVGHVIKLSDLILKSPADGIPANERDRLIGRRTVIQLREEQILDWSFFDGEY